MFPQIAEVDLMDLRFEFEDLPDSTSFTSSVGVKTWGELKEQGSDPEQSEGYGVHR